MAMCFICLQTKKNKAYPKSLQHCEKQCVCDGQVHDECIAKWFDHTPICPICRKSIGINNKNPLLFYLLREHAQHDFIIYAVWTITIIIIIFVLPIDKDFYY